MNNGIGLGLLLATAAAQGQPPIEATLAWDGQVAAATYTEVAIGGRNIPRGPLVVRMAGGSPQVEAALPAGTSGLSSLTLPLPVTGAADIRLHAVTGDTAPTVIVAGRLRPGPGTIAVAGARIAAELESVPAALMEPFREA